MAESKKKINLEIHPAELAAIFQLVQYQDLKVNTQYFFTILNYANIRSHRYGDSGYIKFAGRAMKSFDKPEIDKGDLIVFEVPYIGFFDALSRLPYRMKLQTIPSKIGIDNIEIKLKKPSDRKLRILDMRRVQGCQEDVKKANEILDLTLWVEEER